MYYTLMQKVKVFAGQGSLSQLPEIMKEAGFTNAFLVCDGGIVKMGLAARVQEILAAAGLKSTLYDKVLPDPPSGLVGEGHRLCGEAGCDCVIAIGGGSSIDTAKGINILRFNEGNILDYANPATPMNPASGLIVIPTTSGTGSELSNGVIITDESTGLKAAMLAPNAMSEYALIDPELTTGMPPMLTMFTGLDVFSHAAEAYTTILASVMIEPICEKLMQDVVTYLPRVIKDGSDIEARERMLVSASLGGWMLACACAHVGHSIAHVVGATFHIPHGRACAASLPPSLEFIAPACPAKVRKIGEILGATYDGSETPEQIGAKTAEAYKAFVAGIGLPALPFAKPGEEGMAKLAYDIAHEPLAVLTPIPVTEENARAMVEKIF